MSRCPVVVLVVALCAPALAMGQAKEVRLSILKLDKGSEKMLLRVESPQGTALQVREVYGDAKPKQGWFVESKAEEQKKLKSLKHKFPVKANVDQMDPDGRVTIMGAPDGHRSYQILAMKDGRLGVVGTIPLEKNAQDQYAKGMLKQVVWLPNASGFMTVVNQQLEHQDGPYDVDDIHFWKFKIWKIKWIKPEGGDQPEKGQGDGEPEKGKEGQGEE